MTHQFRALGVRRMRLKELHRTHKFLTPQERLSARDDEKVEF
jgi:hypothetical protein